jgi:ribosomal protein L44E
LYFGTPSENAMDRETNQPNSVWQKTVAKYGEAEARKMQARGRDHSRAGKGNAGKPKSDEHRRKISEAIKLSYQRTGRISKGGRPRKNP